jgi:phosphogluconate dehydratase
MPELHGLLPALGSLQDMGYKVALITDGRMSGASGKVPSAIHLTPEAKNGGLISKIEDGDIITLDINNGTLNIETTLDNLEKREEKNINLINNNYGSGRELFSPMRKNVSGANEGATIFSLPGEEI